MGYIYRLRYFDYISLHQNHLACSITESVVANVYDISELTIGPVTMIQELTNELISELLQRDAKNEYLFWDARNILQRQVHSFEQLHRLRDSYGYKCIVFLFDNENPAKLAIKELKKDTTAEIYTYDKEGLMFLYGDSIQNEGIKSLFQAGEIKKTISEEIRCFLFHQFITDTVVLTPVPSSNVYANRYFDAKKLFCNNNVFNLVVYQMMLILMDRFGSSSQNFDSFICASVNGACIASALSVLIKKPVVFLRNVGPYMNVSDESMIID